MGRRHQVDYPQVPQGHQLHEQPSTRYLDRYSWMDNGGDGDRRRTTAYVQPQSMAIPAISDRRREIRDAAPAELPAPDPPKDDWTKQKEAQMNQVAYNALPVQPPLPLLPQQFHSQPLVPALASREKALERAPSPEKRPEKVPLAPDSNPLSPRLPVDPRRNERRNTNMGITSPPNLDFTAAAYQPVAQPARGGSWRHGLGSCAEPSICATGLFCPCILYGRVQYRLSLRSEKKDASNMLGYKALNKSCIAWSVLCGINGILSGIQKSRIRRSYDMVEGSGSCLSDCLQGCCCCCCVLAQNEKEIKHREEDGPKNGVHGQEGYVPPNGMTFSSQA